MKSLTCKDTLALLPKYTENAVTAEEAVLIEEHLCNCQECFEKYLSLKNLSDKIKNAFNDINSADYTYEQKVFQNNISAFIDNELDKIDTFAIQCYVAKSQKAKKELEQFMQFEDFLKQNIEKNKNLLKNDLSKKIVDEVQKEFPDYIYKMYIKAAVITILFITLTIFAGYFSIPDNIDKITSFTTNLLAVLPFN